MIGVRLTDEYERRLKEMARRAGMGPGPFARRILMAYLENSQSGPTVEAKLSSIARHVARLEKKVDTFLENAELID
jgi:hypothetical protein